METWLLLTAYRKSPALYPMVLLPTPYDLPFSHNTAQLAYYVYSALWPFKLIQRQWIHVIWKPICDILLVINSNQDPISHRLTTIYPWQTGQKFTAHDLCHV